MNQVTELRIAKAIILAQAASIVATSILMHKAFHSLLLTHRKQSKDFRALIDALLRNVDDVTLAKMKDDMEFGQIVESLLDKEK